MTMVELNEQAEEVVFCPNCGWNSAMDGKALPAPDDGLIGKLLEAADDWRRLSDPENEELSLAAATALQSQAALIERLRKAALAIATGGLAASDAAYVAAVALEAQDGGK